ncbi:hypothetical protein LZ757_02415 [Xylella fastidiosa subsp. morus]|nr:hypothetical protein [Xylella fastidiosa]UIT37796.1 hypothetical protein LZ757_02415 [Xylella fastidiosa subsp. morus]
MMDGILQSVVIQKQ